MGGGGETVRCFVRVFFVTCCAVQLTLAFIKNSDGKIPKEHQFCVLPEIGDSGSANNMRFKSSPMIQGHKECEGPFPERYPNIDGTCNNVFNKGAANRIVRRLLKSEYEDGSDKPRTTDTNGKDLATATEVSFHVHPDLGDKGMDFTVMLMQWGQFIDHEIAGLPISAARDRPLRCCGKNGRLLTGPLPLDCFPILLNTKSENKRFVGECMEMARSVAAVDENGNQMKPRDQLNEVTSYIDASNVYGHSEELLAELREGPQGFLLRTSRGNLMPRNEDPGEACMHEPDQFCFKAGDVRVNEQPALAAMHTIFVRLHNIIAKELFSFNFRAKNETIFQETRRIIMSIMQNINYGEYLPLILGKKAMKRYALATGQRTRFIPSIDPRASNEFASAAFRFGHSLIPPGLHIGDRFVQFRKMFNRPTEVHRDLTELIKSLIRPTEEQGSLRMDRFFTNEITFHLFEPRAPKQGRLSFGLDLVALNIQRARDHGIPPFNHYRKFCGLPPLESFERMPEDVAVAMKNVYPSPDEIDLFPGLMIERPDPGELVGPTLSCILADQFHALKFGDRFYFETDSRPEGFTKGQLRGLRKVTMAKVLCATLWDLRSVPRNAFRVPSSKNPKDKCSKLRNSFLDLSHWRDLH